ncbi:lyr motif-containing protein 2 [Plakobranchus ocellatus]|uniref:LYR motif-containing protein 2 n=1 Tax=Plakobranchus ocellatus TaxID=259542 RepID=A0AAV3ZTI8_9GAST|nr:lyr motif-containing protein 2 [Plakobranchus ocellatus]
MPPAHLTLTQFILRSEVLKLYRSMLRVTYRIDDVEQRKNLQQWIRTDFENNRHHSDEEAIRMMLSKGKLSLRELEQAVGLAQ